MKRKRGRENKGFSNSTSTICDNGNHDSTFNPSSLPTDSPDSTLDTKSPQIGPRILKPVDHVGVCCSSPFQMDIDSNTPADTKNISYKVSNPFGLEYGVEDNPPIHMCFVYGLQQVLLSIDSTISIPLIVTGLICVGDQEGVKAEIMSTFLFMCGVCTLLQDTIGVRLPIIQGGCHKFVPAVTALMALDKWKCPDASLIQDYTSNLTLAVTANDSNVGLDPTEVWQVRMREIQGGIILASITQVVIGCTGVLGFLLSYIGPLTVIPTVTLVGLSLIGVAMRFCQNHWGIAFLTIFLVFLFSLYLRKLSIPIATCSLKKGCYGTTYPIFKLLPVILAIAISWGLCGILTATNVFPNNSSLPEYHARTDARIKALESASWFFFPYPGQWGMPTVSLASYMAMLAATMTSIIESVGDYYACARISYAPPPPPHAVNRGIAMEGFGSIISGLVGSGGATTSYSQNVGAIGVTKVASRRAFQAAGLIFIFCGCFGKFGAVMTMVPDPVLGGVVVISFGMVTSVGLSTLQFVDLSSARNMCILGSSLVIGLMMPEYMKTHQDAINTGNIELDQVITVLLSTSMFIGGVLGFLLDNTVPGTDEERGIIKWRQQLHVDESQSDDTETAKGDDPESLYDLPYIMPLLRKCKCTSYVPFLPTFKFRNISLFECCRQKCKKSSEHVSKIPQQNSDSRYREDLSTKM